MFQKMVNNDINTTEQPSEPEIARLASGVKRIYPHLCRHEI